MDGFETYAVLRVNYKLVGLLITTYGDLAVLVGDVSPIAA
jgi:hypothetical protein